MNKANRCGVAGDVVYENIAPARYAMAKRGVCKVPVVGVLFSKWSVAQVRKRATPQTGDKRIHVKQELKDKVIEHKQYIAKYGKDLPESRDWRWGAGRGAASAAK